MEVFYKNFKFPFVTVLIAVEPGTHFWQFVALKWYKISKFLFLSIFLQHDVFLSNTEIGKKSSGC